ncbi:MAG: hypothetical protein ABIJ85_03540 [bacterium]
MNKNRRKKIIGSEWLTSELKDEILDTFEPCYKRRLTEKEVVEIAMNLVSYTEHYIKFKWRIKHEQSN